MRGEQLTPDALAEVPSDGPEKLVAACRSFFEYPGFPAERLKFVIEGALSRWDARPVA